ncbi:unnamed protein product, partial [Didymodactylos carnosus]
EITTAAVAVFALGDKRSNNNEFAVTEFCAGIGGSETNFPD